MKRIIKCIAIFLGVFLICLNPTKAKAVDDGYYIKNMNVEVEVTDKREYIITETIDVYFNVESHGIKRNIPVNNRVDKTSITDVSVEGDKYTKTDPTANNSELVLKIGDSKKTVIGDKRYVIKYTLNNHGDNDEKEDFLYLNLLGNEWDTRVEKFNATLKYPSDAVLKKVDLADGVYGGYGNSYSSYTTQGNTINVKSTKVLEAGKGITIKAFFNEGAFKNAYTIPNYCTILEENTNIEITKEKKYLVVRDIELRVNEGADKNEWTGLPIWKNDKKRIRIEDFSCDNSEVKLNKSNYKIKIPSTPGIYKLRISYTVVPRIDSSIKLDLALRDRNVIVEKLNVSIKSPKEKFSLDQTGVGKGKTEKLEGGEYLYTFNNNAYVKANEEASIDIKYFDEESLFYRENVDNTVNIYFSIGISLLILLSFYIIRQKNNKIDKNGIDFYPPKGINNLEAAYIYNGDIDNRDVTSLIFYWASHLHLKVVFERKGNFRLIKLKELDNNHEQYEKILFYEIFRNGNGVEVSSKQLEGKISTALYNAKKAVKKKYSKEKEIISFGSFFIAIIGIVISVMPLVYLSICHIKNNVGDINSVFMRTGIYFVQLLAIFIFIYRNYGVSFSKEKRRKFLAPYISFVIIYSPLVLFELMTVDGSWVTKGILVISSYIFLGITLIIPGRNKHGKEMVDKISGFRNFVYVAEKDRLESLLKDDPEYFYRTLPYAHALGVTDIWKNKFDNIAIIKSEAYVTYGYSESMLDKTDFISAIISSMSNISKTIDNYSSSDSSYGGGSSSDGGFSGGGSGGGGGSRW